MSLAKNFKGFARSHVTKSMIALFLVLFLIAGTGSGWFGRRFLRVTVPFLALVCFFSALCLVVLKPIWTLKPPISNKWILASICVGPVAIAAALGYWIKLGIFLPLMFSGHFLSAEFSLLLDQFIFSGKIFNSSSKKPADLKGNLQNSGGQFKKWIPLANFLYYARMFGFFQWPVSILFIIVNCLVGVAVVAIYLKIPHQMTIFGQAICGNWLILYSIFELVGMLEGSCRKRTFFPYQSASYVSGILFFVCLSLAVLSVWVQYRKGREVNATDEKWEIFSLEES